MIVNFAIVAVASGLIGFAAGVVLGVVLASSAVR